MCLENRRRPLQRFAGQARLASADLLAEQQRLQRLDTQLGQEMAQWEHRAEEAVGNPAFDLTPAHLVHGIITDRGVANASASGLRACFPERTPQ